MAKYISFGQFNKKYFFILGSITVRIIVTFISGFTPYLTPNNTIYIFGFKSYFFSHPLITYCLQYFSLCLGGIILQLVLRDKKNNTSSKKINLFIDKNSSLTTNLSRNSSSIYTKYIFNDKNKCNDIKYFGRIFCVFSLYYFAKIAMTSFDNMGYNRVKYWPLEFIFLYIFSKKILNRSMYKHQGLSLITLMIVCTTIYVINSFIPQSSKDCSSCSGDELKECEILGVNIYEDINHKFGWFFIPIIILLYLAAMASNAYSSITSKWFMDIKYINLNRILIYLGGIGLFYSTILLIIFSHLPCSKENNIISYVCKLDYQGLLFYDNYNTFKAIDIDSYFFIDVFLIIPLFIISSFLSIFFELLIIKDLDPFYLIPIDCAYFLIYEIIDYCITFSIRDLYRNLKFACQVSSNVIAIFLCTIYLEIIELHFYSLDMSLRRYIIQREQTEKKRVLEEINEVESDVGSVELYEVRY